MNQKQAKELVRSRLSDKRYEHTLNVKKMAVKLAKRYGVDEDKAALAALLHDSAKEISKDEMRELMRQYPQYAEGGEERPTGGAGRRHAVYSGGGGHHPRYRLPALPQKVRQHQW